MTKEIGGDDVENQLQKLDARVARAQENFHTAPINEQKKHRLKLLARLERYHQSAEVVEQLSS